MYCARTNTKGFTRTIFARQNLRGFTLIEILVSIGVLALMIAIGMPNLVSSRQRASDAAKKASLASLKKAMQLYFADHQQYPAADVNGAVLGCGIAGDELCPPVTSCPLDEQFAAGGTDGCAYVYMKQLPVGFVYFRNPNKAADDLSDYRAKILLENPGDGDADASQKHCAVFTPDPGYYYICPD